MRNKAFSEYEFSDYDNSAQLIHDADSFAISQAIKRRAVWDLLTD